jgi:hypothetical protein
MRTAVRIPDLDKPKEGRTVMSFDWQEAELPPQLLPQPWYRPGRNQGERQGTVEFKRRSSLLMSKRASLLRLQALPRLTREQELEALACFRATHGVVRCPPAFVAPSQAAVG